ncbi:MAG: hypothetical protein A2452_10495 [Candidatus Firestonebacteria bacterium RIFOXYC2_FULL_39_67]|nr:MAG: hypothetical protein A2452_10495 [Candidatus Firestonebacteria bacterium RIFOXYC2_FULL_39_67]OGF58031.1 MAG: hypothetical protein A2497_06785 [Candidatus Firestonebacteria bacterium RifOxyC12_full_39_7]
MNKLSDQVTFIMGDMVEEIRRLVQELENYSGYYVQAHKILLLLPGEKDVEKFESERKKVAENHHKYIRQLNHFQWKTMELIDKYKYSAKE